LAELARRLSMGMVPGLAGRRLLLVDGRFTAPEQSRQRLFALLSQLDDKELVVAIDGLAPLLRCVQGSNKALLFSTLSDVGARIIGLVTLHEYQELFSDDAATRDFFTRVDIGEPEVETAKRMVGQMAQGLARQFALTITPEAIDRAVVLSHNYILNEQLPGK